jgi:L-ascorbate metabolism protein UlaG (beta-lactamase superfamily)
VIVVGDYPPNGRLWTADIWRFHRFARIVPSCFSRTIHFAQLAQRMGSPLPTSYSETAPRRRSPLLLWVGICLVLLILLIGAILISGCAAFGAKPQGERLARAQQSPQWYDGHFKDPQAIWIDTRRALLHFTFGASEPTATPDAPIPVVHPTGATFAIPPQSGLRVTWFGHSSTLLEIDGSNILIDPFWGERASPFSWGGPKRWYPPPIALSELPPIDVVLISHDHYDHLDYPSIVAMKSWHNVFVVPLGVGAHLSRWGIPNERIIELDWWQSARHGNIEVVATPARHASGRLSPNSDHTLWAGFAVIGDQHRAWYSGDTSYHNDLHNIGTRFGPFDVTLIEAGQYDAAWADNHLGPELAVQAHIQVRGRTMIPVHWALLKLAQHTWTEPVERVLVAARCHDVEVLAPRPGESIEPTQHPVLPQWWPHLQWDPASERPVLATLNGDPAERVTLDACSVH